MIISVFLFLIGFICLIKGGDWFVDGATGIAQRFHLPELLIGATVVSIGTTLPEVMVSATSALSGHSEIAYGNAIGSVICNTALIAAVTIAIRPEKAERKTLILPISFFFATALFYAGTAYICGTFDRIVGIILLAIFVAYMISTVKQMTKMAAEDNTLSGAPACEVHEGMANQDQDAEGSAVKDILLLVVGAGVIAVGADLLVDNGTVIAQYLGVPESVIALTLVALGTSLPELVTAVTSLVKGHSALSLGNIIGANLFNLVLVCGTSITLRPFDVPTSSIIFGKNASLALDFPVMFGVMLLLAVPALIKERLFRWQGIILLIIYFTYCVIQFTM